MSSTPITRRGFQFGAASLGTLAVLDRPAAAQRKGGNAVVAQQARPPTLDAMTTTAQAARNISLHIFEMLVTRDEQGNTIPDLAESYEVAPDGMTITFKLRRGVAFHNGREFTSKDAKASLERYAKVGGSADIMRGVQSIEANTPAELVLRTSHPMPMLLDQISSPRAPAVMIPEDEAGKPMGAIRITGTGPYQLVEYMADSHALLKRFDDYVANPNYTQRDGLGGRKTPYLDTVQFRFMPEAETRTAALQTGEVTVVEALPTLTAKRLAADRALRTYEMMPWGFQVMFVNASQPPTNNPKVRQAMQVALNMEEIMAVSSDGSYRLDHGWQYPNTLYWAGDIGKEYYNRADRDGARRLLQDAGYKGQVITLLTDTSYKGDTDTTVVARQQWLDVGLNVEIKAVDGPTALAMRLKREGWNTWTAQLGIEPYEGPIGVASYFAGPNNSQFKQDPGIDQAFESLANGLTLEIRKRAFADFQRRMYEEFYAIKLGDFGIYQASTAKLQNFEPYRIPRMWDVWFA